jgi:hypothetical protein
MMMENNNSNNHHNTVSPPPQPSFNGGVSSLYRPIPLNFLNSYFQSLLNSHHSNHFNQQQQQQQNVGNLLGNFVSVAGADINTNSQVFLLYEIPTYLLARRFMPVVSSVPHEAKFKIMVSFSFYFQFFCSRSCEELMS